MNAQNGFYSMQHPEWPLLPCNCLNLPTHWLSNSVYGAIYALEDLDFDWDAQAANSRNAAIESNESENFSPLDSFGPDDLWLEITEVDPGFAAYVILHGTVDGEHYQLLSKTNLDQPGPWKLGEIRAGDANTNQTPFSGVLIGNNPKMFLFAHHANAIFDIAAIQNAIEPTNSVSGQDGIFQISNRGTESGTACYTISGSAVNGVDYTNLSGVITVPAQ